MPNLRVGMGIKLRRSILLLVISVSPAVATPPPFASTSVYEGYEVTLPVIPGPPETTLGMAQAPLFEQDPGQGGSAASWPGLTSTGRAPADPTIAVGPTYVALAVNAVWRLYDKYGNPTDASRPFQTLASWFGVPTNWLVRDPFMTYDRYDGRYIFVAFSEAPDQSDSRIEFTVSRTSDPRGSWCKYSWKYNNGYLHDFPKVGYDSLGVYVTANIYSAGPVPSFVTAAAYAMPKSALYNDSVACNMTRHPFVGFKHSNGSLVRNLIPAISQLATSGEYFTATYSEPAGASQPGTDTQLRTGGSRVHSVASRGASLWIASGSATFPSKTYAEIRVASVDIAAWSNTVFSLVPPSQEYYFFPVLVFDTAGNLFCAFGRSGSAAGAPAGYPTFSFSRLVAGAWTAPILVKRDGKYERGLNSVPWGDYSTAAVDNAHVWFYGMYAVYDSSNDRSDWATWVHGEPT